MMPFAAGQLVFLHPIVLAGLLALPLLWFLLRVFPPVPRMIHLPSAWLLDGLVPEEQTTSKTPWWILLLRTILAALIIIAMAEPVINPAAALNMRGPVRIVMENGWASAQTWSLQRDAAQQILDRAARDKRAVYILPTAADAGQNEPVQQGPMTAAQAETVLRGLKPRPWPSDYAAIIPMLEKNKIRDGVHSFWISHGLDDGRGIDLAKMLQNQGGLSFMEPSAAQRPLLLIPRNRAGQNLNVAINASKGTTDQMPVSIEAIGADGRVIDRRDHKLNINDLPAEITFDLPDTLRGQITQIRLAGRTGAGGIVMMDDVFSRRTIGLVSDKDEGQSSPLTEAGFYLTRALEPTGDVITGTIDELLERKNLPAMILPDIGTLPPETLEALEKWTRRGGLLIRFAGPNMSEAENFLTPTPLRRGERALDGSLTWEKPKGLAPFPSTSPLYGLPVPPDLDVRQQILAEPVADMDRRTWASLSDGTPLITASPLDKGLIILVHTTATPLWSNLALSGLYVEMLQRFVALAGSSDPMAISDGVLHPIQVLDGYGAIQQPDSTVQPIDATTFDKQMPDPDHPPGLYGRSGLRKVLNLGDRIKTVNVFPPLPAGVERMDFTGRGETNAMPFCLLAAFVLFLIDWAVMIVIQAYGTGRLRLGFTTLAIAVLLASTTPGMAQGTTASADMVQYASAIHLAYVKSNNPEVDSTTRRGLETLVKVLNDRTSVEPAGVVGVDPEHDELSFFPLIYWPVTIQQTALSQTALQNIQFYLDHGGTILFDTRDNGVGGTTRNAITLRNLTAGLDVAPLVIAPRDHVLTKSFYLLKTFPGRYDNANLWVEEQSASGRDGVSSVLVGGNDWASAWAGISPPEGSQDQEMALRFGVNMMMYALTGNYKADQVHVPHILQRLGQ